MDDMQINNNTNSTIIQRSIIAANKEAANSIEKLAYGKQTSAIQDAAGSIIADQMEIQSRGSDEAAMNVQAGASLLQTADSDLGNISDNLQKMRELTIQAANGTNSPDDLNAIKSQISSLSSEIDRVSKTSSFVNINLLDGSNKDLALQTGANSDSNTNSMLIGSVLDSASTSSLGVPTGTKVDEALSSSTGSSDMLESIDKAISTINDRRSTVGAFQNVLDSTSTNLQIKSQNLQSSESLIRDTDVAKESSILIKSQILQDASVSLLSQANQKHADVLGLLGI